MLNTNQIGYERHQKQLDFITNRIVYAIIIGSLIIAAGISYSLAIGKQVAGLFGLPGFSIFCLATAAVFGFIIFINDIRSNRNRNQ